MTFLALLFAVTPSLEAVACAMEGCGIGCAEQGEGPSASTPDDPASDGCVEKQCACVATHCSHVAISVAEIQAEPVAFAASRAIPVATERPVPSALPTPERPPRA